MIHNFDFDPQTGEVFYLPEILIFDVDRRVLTDHTPVVVKWQVDFAERVLLCGQIVEPKGEKRFHSHSTIDLELIADNSWGEVSRNISIAIDKTPPVIHSFSIDKQYATKGAPVTLTWDVQGASAISIDNGIGDVGLSDNTITVSLGTSGCFKLIASNFFGYTSIAVTTVQIFPCPIIHNLFLPKPNFYSQAISGPNSPPSIVLDASLFSPSININMNMDLTSKNL
jgi:hypothetical protein